MKPFDRVIITKSTKSEYIGFEGELHTNLRSFHINAGVIPMPEILTLDRDENCIGIIGDNGVFWWTKHSDFDVEIAPV